MIDQDAVKRFLAGVPETATIEEIRTVLTRMSQALMANERGHKLPGGVSRETMQAVMGALRTRLDGAGE